MKLKYSNREFLKKLDEKFNEILSASEDGHVSSDLIAKALCIDEHEVDIHLTQLGLAPRDIEYNSYTDSNKTN